MKILRYSLSIIAAAMLILFLDGVSAQAADHEMKVGKRGEIMFNTEVRIGDLTLRPGHYRLQHRTEGSDHFVQFTLLRGMHNLNRPGGPMGFADAGQIKCRVESLDGKVDRTAILSREEDGAQRVIRILVHGENVAHLF